MESRSTPDAESSFDNRAAIGPTQDVVLTRTPPTGTPIVPTSGLFRPRSWKPRAVPQRTWVAARSEQSRAVESTKRRADASVAAGAASRIACCGRLIHRLLPARCRATDARARPASGPVVPTCRARKASVVNAAGCQVGTTTSSEHSALFRHRSNADYVRFLGLEAAVLRPVGVEEICPLVRAEDGVVGGLE
jgi:hypothetical protein